MATMSKTKVRDRELMMLSMTSSRIEVVGAWSEFAVVGIVNLRMMCLRFRASWKLYTLPLAAQQDWSWRSSLQVAHCSSRRDVIIPEDEWIRMDDGL